MLKLFIASHGSIASGMKSAVNILLGKSDNVTAFDAYLDEKNLKDELEKYFKTVADADQVIMLSDLYGGSVNQTMYLFLSRPNTYLIAGINLALVLDLCIRTQPLERDQIQELFLQNREALQLVEIDQNKSEEGEFFEASND